MGIKRYKVLYDDSAEGTGDWVRLDSRYEESPTRTLRVEMTSGDTITLEGIVHDEKGIDKSFLDELTDSEISVIKEYTETEDDILEGNWTYIRIVKEGTAGAALIEGFV